MDDRRPRARRWLRAVVLAILVGAVALVAWQQIHKPQPRAGELPPGTAFDVGGVRVELPWPVAAPAGVVWTGAFRYTTNTPDGQKQFELVNGRVRLNGKSYGTVKAGDRLRVTADGAVFVNDAERPPEGG